MSLNVYIHLLLLIFSSLLIALCVQVFKIKLDAIYGWLLQDDDVGDDGDDDGYDDDDDDDDDGDDDDDCDDDNDDDKAGDDDGYNDVYGKNDVGL